MKYMRNFVLSLSIILLLFSASLAAEYYVDATNGNDNNLGTSQGAPWKTIAKINESSFSPGDNIFLKRGCEWREMLVVSSSGSSNGGYITFSAYGTGANPIINAGKWFDNGAGG